MVVGVLKRSQKFNFNAEPLWFVEVVIGYATITLAQLAFYKNTFLVKGCDSVFSIKKNAFFNRRPSRVVGRPVEK